MIKRMLEFAETVDNGLNDDKKIYKQLNKIVNENTKENNTKTTESYFRALKLIMKALHDEGLLISMTNKFLNDKEKNETVYFGDDGKQQGGNGGAVVGIMIAVAGIMIWTWFINLTNNPDNPWGGRKKHKTSKKKKKRRKSKRKSKKKKKSKKA